MFDFVIKKELLLGFLNNLNFNSQNLSLEDIEYCEGIIKFTFEDIFNIV